MDLDIKQHLPENFYAHSKVWIYQSNRLFLISEVFQLEEMLNEFVQQWKSHGDDVTGFASLFYGRFIVLMADESKTGVSGCSTDSSVRLIKKLEEQFNVQLFNRQLLAFVIKDKIELIPMEQLPYAINNKFITPNSTFFNNAITTKEDLESKWIVPAGESWLSRYFEKSIS